MEEVRVAEKRLSDYRAIIGGPAFAEILAMASKLKGKRVAHVNATGYGGGGAGGGPSPPPPPPGRGPPVPRFPPRGSAAHLSPAENEQNPPPGPPPGPAPGP